MWKRIKRLFQSDDSFLQDQARKNLTQQVAMGIKEPHCDYCGTIVTHKQELLSKGHYEDCPACGSKYLSALRVKNDVDLSI